MRFQDPLKRDKPHLPWRQSSQHLVIAMQLLAQTSWYHIVEPQLPVVHLERVLWQRMARNFASLQCKWEPSLSEDPP